MRYYGIDFNGDGINDMGEQYIDLSPVRSAARPYGSRRKKDELHIGRDVGCFMALIVGVTFFILSYI